MKSKSRRRALAAALLLAAMFVFVLEGAKHRHSGGADGHNCPACQSARLGVGDAPGPGVILPAPACARAPEPDQGSDLIAIAAPVSSSAPRSPPALSA